MIIQINLENGKPIVAQVIDEPTAQRYVRKMPSKYPWDEWSDGQWREISFQEVGEKSLDSFRDAARKAARRRRLRLSMHVDVRAGKFRFRFLDWNRQPLRPVAETVEPSRPVEPAKPIEPIRTRSGHGVFAFAM